jgi:sugar phosphate isomerase/epimerase
MNIAISNIALPSYNHTSMFYLLNEAGIKGLEVAPSRVWHDTWHNLSANQVNDYRSHAEKSDLPIIGLHSLLYDHPELGFFDSIEKRNI